MSTPLQAQVTLCVPFHDVDPAGIVWHGRYAKYFELARCALLDRIGYGYREMSESGYVWPILDMSARFFAPAFYKQTLLVQATLTEWDYRLKIDYEIFDEDGARMTKAMTTQVPVLESTRKMALGVPPFVIDLIDKAADA